MKPVQNITTFLQDFTRHSGNWIMTSLLVKKVVLFIIKWFLLITLQKIIYGKLTMAMSIVAMVLPFVGLGVNAGLMRFGSLLTSAKEKHELYSYSFTIGIVLSVLMAILIFPFVPILAKQDSYKILLVSILLLRIPALFIYEALSVYFRIQGKNKLLAYFELGEAILLLCFVLVLTKLFGVVGYVTAVIAAPILITIVFSIKNGFPTLRYKWSLTTSAKAFWSFSIWASFAQIISDLVYLVDILVIGYMLNDIAVAEYNVAALIPANLLFLPQAFIKTDYKRIAENYLNKEFLSTYYKNFSLLFIVVSIVLIIGSVLFGEWMFSFLKKDYSPYQLFLLLMIGAAFSMILRVPLGNMIGALGKTRVNTIIGALTILVDVILNILLIPNYGLTGAAIATIISLLISGILSYGYFTYYLNKLKSE